MFKYKKLNILISIVFVAVLFAENFSFVSSATQPDVKSVIDQKSQELQNLNSQIQGIQKDLDSTRTQKQSLQGEIKLIDKNLNQLKLGIKVSSIAVEKLGLEIGETQSDISESELEVQNKSYAIAEALRQIQQKGEDGNPIILFLKNKSLASSLSEVQSLINLQDRLSSDIAELRNLKEDLDNHLKISSEQKKQKEMEAENLKNKKVITEETKKYRQNLLSQTKNKEQNYQQSLTELQKRQEQIALEIEKLDAEARGKINTSTLPTRGSGILAVPVNGILTQEYGATSFALAGGYRGKWHNGLDYSAPIGTSVFAAESGTVVSVGNQDLYCYRGAYGKFIAISHDNGLTTLYGHLSLQVVKEGARVNRGDLIGYIGNTGYSTGPHLHFTVYASNTFKIGPAKTCGPKMPFGGDLNPMNYL